MNGPAMRRDIGGRLANATLGVLHPAHRQARQAQPTSGLTSGSLPSTLGSMRRTLIALLALCIVAAVLHWLMSRPVVRFSLGPADAIVAAPGVGGFAVREPGGAWRLYSAGARKPEDGRLLPGPVIGMPALQADGSIFVLAEDGLRWVHGSQPLVPGGEVLLVLSRDDLPADCRLEGVIGGKHALLSSPVSPATGASGPRKLLLCEGSLTSAKLRPVFDADSEARMPPGVTPVLAHGAPAVAFPGEDGWEAWSLQAPNLAHRAVAEGCVRPGAVFTPDGQALIVPGRTDGLWMLNLKDGRLNLMAEGNLGVSRRVPHSVGFRGVPAVMVAPGWDLENWLQIYQTHLSGGGRSAFGAGFMHHYLIVISTDRNLMTYAQANFDEKSDAPFAEDLYLFNFAQPGEPAIFLDTRQGGGAAHGPSFVGTGGSLVYLARGEALRIETLPHTVRKGTP